MSKPISMDLVGMTFEPVSFNWSAKDVMLYAVGVGAKPEGELEYVFEGKGPRVLPTYAVIPGMLSMGGLISNVEINLAMLLHGEQSITLHREIPAEGKVKITGRISEVWDKGKAAVIGSEGIVEDDKGVLFTTKATLFIRGAGGFGGDPSRFRHFAARFADQVYFGDTIVTKMWVVGDGDAIVQAETQKGNVVLSQARAKFAA